MTMTDKEIIREVLGRMADRAPRSVDLDEMGDPVVDARASSRRITSGPRLAVAEAAIAAAVVLVAAVFALLNGADDATPVGTPASATVQEFEAALTSAFGALDRADGIEGTQEAYIQGHLSATVWFTSRANGDSAVVQRADIDVRDTAWWITSPSPPAVGEHIATTAWVVADGVLYEATESEQETQPWQVLDAEPPGSLAFGLTLFDEDFAPELRGQLAPPGSDVTRQATANGGAIWTVAIDEARSRFYIHPDGHLATWSWQDLAPAASGTMDAGSGEISYRPLDDPEPISAPQPGSSLDLSNFDFPQESQ